MMVGGGGGGGVIVLAGKGSGLVVKITNSKISYDERKTAINNAVVVNGVF